MTEYFKNSEPFGMKFRKLRNHASEFHRFEGAKSVQITSIVIKIS